MCLCLCARGIVCASVRARVINNINNVPVGSYHRQTDDNRQSDSEAGRGADKQINRNRQTDKTQEADGRTDRFQQEGTTNRKQDRRGVLF